MKSVDEYNKYFGKDAKAEIVSKDEKRIVVRFSGHFCKTCGYHDYFDDFIGFFEEEGIELKAERIEEKADGAIVTFSL